MSIVGSEGESLPDLRLGEIVISGPCVTPGYVDNPAATAAAIVDGRLHTGDLGFTYGGEFFFCSRKDDLMNVGGQNVVPDDVELAVEDLDYVRMGGTMLVPGSEPELSTSLRILVEVGTNLDPRVRSARSAEIQQRIQACTGLLVNQILFCPYGTIEKTSSGKKRRRVVQQRLQNGEIQILGREH
jgi:fatty-acyl-CoA synthase